MTTASPLTIVQSLAAHNPVIKSLGIEILSVAPGSVSLSMLIREDMLNSRGTCHGGYIFTLGDQTAGFACMTGNEHAVTQSAHITYISAAQRGERLLARGSEAGRSRRSGTYDVTITGEGGRVAALVRCQFVIVGPEILSSHVPS